MRLLAGEFSEGDTILVDVDEAATELVFKQEKKIPVRAEKLKNVEAAQ